MEQVVIDTDVIIDFLRTGKGLFLELLDLQSKSGVDLFISSITVFELFGGQLSRGQEHSLQGLISKLKVVSFDIRVAQLAGELNRNLKYSLKLTDLAIGATGLVLDARLATKNKKHFQEIPKLKFFDLK